MHARFPGLMGLSGIGVKNGGKKVNECNGDCHHRDRGSNQPKAIKHFPEFLIHKYYVITKNNLAGVLIYLL
jgi:hypothetical protein